MIVTHFFVYYETIKRELQVKTISECRCDKRLKTKVEESTCLSNYKHWVVVRGTGTPHDTIGELLITLMFIMKR